MLKPVVSIDRSYQDAFIKIDFIVLSQVGFKLKNKTNAPIEVDWSRASFVDFEGEAQRVTHEGMRYIERDKPPAPSVIPPEAQLTDTVIPVNKIEYYSDSGWKTNDTIPSLNKAEGKTFAVFLPIKVRGVVKNYHFTFKVEKDLEATAKAIKENALSASELKKASISKQEFGDNWPFIMPAIEIACARGAVFAINKDRIYALNMAAEGKTIEGRIVSTTTHEIKTTAARYGGTDKIQMIVDRGLTLCSQQ
jgi:hypothetical protein